MKRRKFLKSAAAGAIAGLPGTVLAAVPGVRVQQPVPSPREAFPLGPDSKYHQGVPRGKVFHFSLNDSQIFPGTERTIDVYIPAQYRAQRPACVFVLLDGLAFLAPIVFDNLIYQREMPVTLAIGLRPGITPSRRPPQNPRFNRSFEFDSVTDILPEFIIHELLPAVKEQKTPDGLPIILSSDPNDHGIAGCSSGGIGAFNVAWQRPDVFRRVYVASGTFVGMRGGERYPVLIRKTEPKPLRVFINDGNKDEWSGGPEFGDWWLTNEEVERALTFAGYDVTHLWGGGEHCQQATSVFPQAMRWLWRGWPRPVVAGETGNFNIASILWPGEDWEVVLGKGASFPYPAFHFQGYGSRPVVDAHSTAAAICSDAQGRVYVQDVSDGRICRISASGNIEPFARVSPADNGLAVGPDGRLYVAETQTAQIVAYNSDGQAGLVARGVRGHRLTVTHQGNIYVTEDTDGRSDSGKVWLISPDGTKSEVAEGLKGPSGVALTPDGLWLCVAESQGHHAYSYQVQANGELGYAEPYYWFHVPEWANNSGAGQVCMDRQGRAYVATRMGVQVFDRNGRVTAILPAPEGRPVVGICFGGQDLQTLYVSTGSKVYRRKVKAQGIQPWAAHVALPPWAAA